MNPKWSRIVKISKISLRNLSTDPLNLLHVLGSWLLHCHYNLKSHSLPPLSPIFCMQPSLAWYLNILLAAAVVNTGDVMDAESLLAIVVAFRKSNELNYMVILYIFVRVCMNVRFGGQPDRRTREAEIWDTGVTWVKKYHRMGGEYHGSNSGYYQEKGELRNFIITLCRIHILPNFLLALLFLKTFLLLLCR